jgi:DNA recombination protein RmuC
MDVILSALTLLASLAVLALATLILGRLRRPAGRELETALREELRLSREEASRQSRELREEVAATQAQAGEALRHGIGELQKAMSALTETTRAEMASQREKIQVQLGEIQLANEQRFEKVREAVGKQLQAMLEEQRRQMADVVASLNRLSETNRQEQEKARATLDLKFRQIQESNEKKLDEMRTTVDEKLHSTLEKRLGESFKLVSERLEAVQRGLGEMQGLATGVGDLKRVLTNVKERGTWGEYQLAAILEEILTPDQFARNVSPKQGGEVVEFAVKLPGRGNLDDQPVWLPIDAKFPKEDYERLLEAANQADAEQVKAAGKALAAAVLKSAKDIHDKYIAPPATTDFGILFLPTEGLYAEVLRQPGLHDELQRKHRVLVAGPTTLSAILSSLRVGFQTLAIEQRAHEVWKVLGAVKTEFGKFGGVLERVQKQLNTASRTLDESARRTRAMERSLRTVEQLPSEQAASILALPETPEPVESDDGETPA